MIKHPFPSLLPDKEKKAPGRSVFCYPHLFLFQDTQRPQKPTPVHHCFRKHLLFYRTIVSEIFFYHNSSITRDATRVRTLI